MIFLATIRDKYFDLFFTLTCVLHLTNKFQEAQGCVLKGEARSN